MRTLTKFQCGKGKLFTLPLLLLGFLIVPFGLLPAHSLPGHAAIMKASASATEHEHEAAQAATPAAPDAHISTDHGGHGMPSCEAGPDYSSIGPGRFSSDRLLDLAFAFLALTAATAVAIAAARISGPRLRKWPSRPHWILAGTDLLAFLGISRT